VQNYEDAITHSNVTNYQNKMSPYREVTVLARHAVSAVRPLTHPARPTTGSVTDDNRRRQQTTDTSEPNNTNPLGEPVISSLLCQLALKTGPEVPQWKTINAKKIQTIDVKITAPIVPTGIDFWASERSPDLFEPDMNPSIARKQYYYYCTKNCALTARSIAL